MDTQILITLPEDGSPVRAAIVTGGAPNPWQGWRDEVGFPKLKKHTDGNTYLLFEPLNPDWKSAANNFVLGGTANGAPFLADPSNSDGTKARRSPAGYPLFYGKNLDGTIFGGLPPSVQFDGQSFPDDAAVADYKLRITQPGTVVGVEPQYVGPINPSTLSETDGRVFYQNYQRMPIYAVFSESPIGKIKMADGRNMGTGDGATPVVDVVAYKAAGGVLAPWL